MNFLSVFNPFGLAFAALLLLPYVIYRRKHPYEGEGCPNKAMTYVARIGMYISLFLMSFHLGTLEQGFTEPKELMERFWIISSAAMIAVYLLLWALILKRGRSSLALPVVIVSAAVVIFSGILQVNTLLFSFGIIYLVGELYLICKHKD